MVFMNTEKAIQQLDYDMEKDRIQQVINEN